MGLDEKLILQNQHLELRPIKEDDLEQLLHISGQSEDWKYYTHDLSTLEGLENWVKPAFDKERLQFVIVLKSIDQIIGSTAFGNFSPRDKRIEIGWTWLGKNFRSKGYNEQVKKMMLDYGFEKMNLERIEFKTDVLNQAAIKSLGKIGAIKEGVLRSHTLMTHNRRRDTLYFSILKEEFRML